MRLTSSRAYTRPTPVPKMPSGLVEIMEGLARDVLKNNPTDVYEFCANHMEKLLEIRDGAPLKKPLTLEQKILKAQETVRQRAKERQERFDSEAKLHSKSHEESIAHNKLDSLHEVIPSLKDPIHHEHDIEHASEVEISHVPHSESSPISEDSSKGHELNVIEEVHEDAIDSSEGTKKIVTVITENQHEYEPIFGKVEREILKEVEIIKIVGEQEVVDSQLQTITEASDENSESTAILVPVITIGDERDNLAQEPIQEIELNIIKEHDIDSSVEIDMKSTNIQNNKQLLENTESNGLEETIEDEPVTQKNTVSSTENIGNSVNIDQSPVLTDDEKQETVQITEIIGVPVTTNTMEHDSDDGNIIHTVQQEISTDSSNVPLDTVHCNDTQNLVILSEADVSNIERVQQDGDLKNEYAHLDTDTDEKQNSKIINTSNTNTLTATGEDSAESESAATTNAEGETKADDEVNMVEVQKADPNIPEIIMEKTEVDKKVETIDQNPGNDESYHNTSSEILLLKSDSTENTNEDSISIVESDLSKTDEDSTQNNPNNMDLETAAVTIQKVFRSFMFKSRNSTFEDTTNDEQNSIDEDNDKKEEYYAAANLNKERRPLGITRMDTVLQTVNEEKSLSLSTDDSSTLSSAATTIQAHVRGFLVRNRLNSSKTFSMNSLVNSHEMLENDSEQHKNKTVLNIHIVPEEGNYLSRDESLITSMDLSLDGSPPSSVNLHPLSYDISERRKMLKREDAVQSVSPPSNNSGKQSEDSVKEILINENAVLEREPTDEKIDELEEISKEVDNEVSEIISSASTVTPTTIITLSKSEDPLRSPREYTETALQRNGRSFTKMSSDESDVITPFVPSPRSSESATRLLHSGEFHDVVLPTKVSRNDTSVVREFKNVLVYFLLWNNL